MHITAAEWRELCLCYITLTSVVKCCREDGLRWEVWFLLPSPKMCSWGVNLVRVPAL